MGNIIAASVLALLALGCFVFGIFQFCQRGILFNNAYLYASRQERERMNKKPYYRQSATVFFLIGALFAVNAAEALLQTGWLFFCAMGIAALAAAFAIVSSVLIWRREKKKGQ